MPVINDKLNNDISYIEDEPSDNHKGIKNELFDYIYWDYIETVTNRKINITTDVISLYYFMNLLKKLKEKIEFGDKKSSLCYINVIEDYLKTKSDTISEIYKRIDKESKS